MTLLKQFTQFLPVIKKHKWFILFFILLAIFRLSLTTSGHYYWPDEGRYDHAFNILERLGEGDVRAAVSSLFKARGRPGFVLFSLIPATVQSLMAKFGLLSPDQPAYNNIPSIFNALMSLVIAVLFYNILRLIVRDQKLCLLGTVLYCLLCNTNIYIRHLLPHDLALFPFMLALFLSLRSGTEIKVSTIVICGLLGAFGFLTYSGYYLFVVILAAVIFSVTKNKIKGVFFYFLSSGSTLLLLEGLSRFTGGSFIQNILGVSGDVTQGSFEEGYTFLFKYLIQVEGVVGGLLIIALLVYTLYVMWRQSSPLRLAFIVLILGYLAHATMSVFLKEMVFYGRVLHMYMPFLVIAVVMTVKSISSIKIQKVLVAILLVCSLISFGRFAYAYVPLNYPKDFREEYLAKVPSPYICQANEAKIVTKIPLERCLALGVNTEYLYPIPSWYIPANAEPRFTLYKEVFHPVNLRAHQFEGFAIRERKRIRDRKYTMRIYLRPFVLKMINQN